MYCFVEKLVDEMINLISLNNVKKKSMYTVFYALLNL